MPSLPAAQHYLPSLGIQLWTVRNEMEKDVPGTLGAIRRAGYAQVELMRVSDGAAVARAAENAGLKVTSAFLDWNHLVNRDTLSAVGLYSSLELGREIGLRYLVFGYIGKGARETAAQLKQHAAAANDFGLRCQDAGIQLCYHHHSFEFAPLADDPVTGWELLQQEFDPELVKFELDVFWLRIAGLDPVQAIRDLRGRVAQVHLKDIRPGAVRSLDEGAVPPEDFREVGRGALDFRAILTACRETGVDQCHVEQDQSPDPVASLTTSADFLRAL